ncbi:hypothetical protein ABW21_db0203666 [Orbilia brochopaga]|nr:hypothetical protein ABW21_db0203666 [Drechslerella brochopaga]
MPSFSWHRKTIIGVTAVVIIGTVTLVAFLVHLKSKAAPQQTSAPQPSSSTWSSTGASVPPPMIGNGHGAPPRANEASSTSTTSSTDTFTIPMLDTMIFPTTPTLETTETPQTTALEPWVTLVTNVPDLFSPTTLETVTKRATTEETLATDTPWTEEPMVADATAVGPIAVENSEPNANLDIHIERREEPAEADEDEEDRRTFSGINLKLMEIFNDILY